MATGRVECSNHFAHTQQFLSGAKLTLNITDIDGDSPLHFAAYYSFINVAKVLVDGGSDPTIADKWGSTTLHNAAMHGCQDMVELLLNAGSDPNIANESG